MSTRAALVLAGLALGACSPVLTPVEGSVPQALPYERVQPQVLWVLDMSGSMASELVSGSALSRRDALLEALGQFATRGLPARHGLVAFPQAGLQDQCAAPTGFAVAPPLASPEGSTAMAEVLAAAQALSPSGGTPTAAALRFTAGAVAVDARTDNYLVLVTDGLPNCNPANPGSSCGGPNPACRCTLAPSTSCAMGSVYCALGCLDQDATIEAARVASLKGLLPLVLGLGADMLSLDATVLSSLGEALPPLCATDADCRSGRGCQPDGTCAERFYSVQTPSDFSHPMERLAAALQESSRCGVWLKHAIDPTDLQVFVGGVEVPAGQWNLTGGQRLRVYGAGCDRLIQSDAPLTFALPP